VDKELPFLAIYRILFLAADFSKGQAEHMFSAAPNKFSSGGRSSFSHGRRDSYFNQ